MGMENINIENIVSEFLARWSVGHRMNYSSADNLVAHTTGLIPYIADRDLRHDVYTKVAEAVVEATKDLPPLSPWGY